MTLTKARIIDSICSNVGLNRSHAKRTLETLLEIIKKTLESGEDVLISGFGKFCVKGKGQRKNTNPNPGGNLSTQEGTVLIFRCSPVLRDKLDGKR